MGSIRETMYTDKVEDLERRKMEKKMDAAQKKGRAEWSSIRRRYR
jgi:hypothetical protein